MDKNDQIIAVVPTDVLFEEFHFQGFSDNKMFEQKILDNIQWMRRGDVENDPTFKQPIGYGLLVNPLTKEIFAYQRAESDERLKGKWSWGIGGHIEQLEKGHENPITSSLIREIGEEVHHDLPIKNFKIIGFINDDSNDVGKVHIGVLYALETESTVAKPKNNEMVKDISKFRKISDLEKLENVETWSSIAMKTLRQRYL